MVDRMKKQMLQYVRRNLNQLKERMGALDFWARLAIEDRIKIAWMIYEQQKQMYDQRVQRIDDRIVSWWRM